MAKMLLIGSTGMIGSRIAAEARDRGHEVTGATRSGGEGRVSLDAADADAVAEAADGHDVIVSAVSPPRDGSDPTGPVIDTGRGVLDGARAAGVGRVLVVGGAGSLLTPDGSRVLDQPWFPEQVEPEARAHAELLELLRAEADDLAWTYVSPAAIIEPGERTGSYELGGDHLVTDDEGNSRISAEEFAAVVVDEVEQGAHVRQRFTAATT